MEPLEIAELEQLKTIMLNMLELAKEANWQELNRADAQRLAILTQTTSQSHNPSLHRHSTVTTNSSIYQQRKAQASKARDAATHRLIEELTRLDSLIIESVQSSRNRLIEKNRELSGQMKAKQLYAQTSQFR